MVRWPAVTVVFLLCPPGRLWKFEDHDEGSVPIPQAHSFMGLRTVGPLFPQGALCTPVRRA